MPQFQPEMENSSDITDSELVSSIDKSTTVGLQEDDRANQEHEDIDKITPVISTAAVPEKTSWLSSKWVWALAAAGLLTLPATLYFAGTVTPKPQPAVTPTPVATVNAVSALGRLEPESEVIKLGTSSAQAGLLKKLLVKEGDRVAVGQILAILDSSDTKQAQLAKAQEDVQVAQAKLEKVKSGAQTGEISAQKAEINRFQQQLRGEANKTKATLLRLKEQLIFEPQAQNSKIQSLTAQLAGEKPTYQARISRLSAQARNATVECNRYNSLLAEKAIQASLRDSKCLEQATAEEQLAETKAQYQQSISILKQQIAENTATKNRIVSNLTQQLREAEATYNQTTATLNEQIKGAQANFDKVSEVRPVDVKSAQAEVASAIASARQAKADLELSYIRAPIAGEVFKIYTKPGESTNTKGLLELAQNQQMVAVAEVYESDIGKIKMGQVAEITSETGAFTGKIQGTVSQISQQIAKKDVLSTDPAADADSRVVEVKLTLNPQASNQVRGLTNSKVAIKINN